MRFLLLPFLLISFSIYSQNAKLGEKEIQDVEAVKFKNKTTKRAAEETKALHEAIGKKLADMALENPDSIQSYKGVKVVRVSSDSKSKFSADIIYLDNSTRFGHIHSIQRILSGYIQNAFEYNEDKADILATYVIYYNAMHRGGVKYIKSKYSDEIIKRTSKSYLGISVNYKNWPGKTEIVIPVEKNILKEFNKDVTLDELEDEVSKVIDTKKDGKEEKEKFDKLREEKKKEELDKIKDKKEEVANLDDLIDNKKKSLEERLEELKKDPNANKDEIALLEKEKKKLDKEKEKTETLKEDVIEKENKLLGKKDSKEESSVAEKKEESKKDSDKKLGEEDFVAFDPEGKKEDSPKKEENSEPAKTDSKTSNKEKETPATTTTKDPVKLEKELADTKKELEAKKEEEKKKEAFSPNVVDGRIIFIKPVTYIEGQCNNEIHLLDPSKDDFVFKSTYNKICGKEFRDFGGNILVVGFKESKDQIHLILLSKKDMKPVGNSEVLVYSKTPLEIRDNNLYAVEFEDGKYYLSRFDKNLKRVLRSSEEINPNAILTFYGKKIYVSGKNQDGKVEFKVFNKEDLKFIKKTQA